MGLTAKRSRAVVIGRMLTWLLGRPRLCGVALVAVVATFAAAGCSSSSAGDGDAWSTAYVDNPDRVWSAIHMTLDELGYEVEDEDRLEGTIRAVEVTDPPSRGFVLHIDQVKRTEVVRVYVRPSGGSASGPERPHQFDEVVRQFLDLLDAKLGRRPQS